MSERSGVVTEPLAERYVGLVAFGGWVEETVLETVMVVEVWKNI